MSPWAIDAFIGTAFTVFGVIGLFQNSNPKFDFRDADALAVLLSLCCSVPYYFRRHAPFAVMMISTAALVVLASLDYQSSALPLG